MGEKNNPTGNEFIAFQLKLEADKLVVEGKFSEALIKYNRSIELDANAPTYVGRARAYRELGEYNLALSDLNLLVSFLNQNFMFSDYVIFFERGLIHERLWNIKSAFADMKRALGICKERKIKLG